MASSSLQVNNPAKTEGLGFTVDKLTRVNAVISLEVDLCKFISQGASVLLPCLCFYLRILDEHLFPWGWGKKKDLKNLAAKTRPNNPLGGENISTGAKTAVLCISWLTLMYMPSPLAENSVKQRDKPAPSRKHDHQKRKKKKSVTRKVFSAYIDINLPAKLWRRKLLQCQRGHSTFTGNIPPLVKAQTQKHSPGFKGQ